MKELNQEDWGSVDWNEAHFPAEQLDTSGDTWGFRWRGREKWRHRVYLDILNGVLRKDQPQRVLDIGCALCDFTNRAYQINPANNIAGMDISETAINWGKKHYPNFELRTGAIPDIPFKTNFDVILCLEVLCYLNADDRKLCFQRMHDLLPSGGKLLFAGVLDGAVRHHSTAEILGLLEDSGFDVEQQRYNHWSLYRKLVEHPLDVMDDKLSTISHRVGAGDEEFKTWRQNKGGGMNAKVVSALRKTAPVSTWFVNGGAKVVKSSLGLETPAKLGNALSKRMRSNEEADELVILATRR